ncbi:transketolase [Neoconidiobolus thromboides FSU 785]|nr:transketolase [Neoconidiobolus thromboides FSU 785]
MVSQIDQLAINTIRVLSAEQVQAANSGHPGAPMGCAPMAHALFSKVMKFNPKNPKWVNRDRFVLSNGHASALLYSLLHLSGYKLSIEDLKAFRQLNSLCPGHPESHLTEGVEVTTGPLGQGISNAVGLAVAEANMAATYNQEGFNLFDSYTYVILGDGCLQEGVSSEASSLAGHLQLGKIIALYDSNHIQIDGSTELGFTEDVVKRYEAYGWHVQSIPDGDNDLESILKAIEEAKKVTDKPSLIKVTTTIGFGSHVAGTHSAHGSPLGKDGIIKAKNEFGFDPEKHFYVPQEVQDLYNEVQQKGSKAEQEWNTLFEQYKGKFPEKANEIVRRLEKRLPEGWEKLLPTFSPEDPAQATRAFSGKVISALAPHLPELIGGSADLTPSNLTRWKEAVDFQPSSTGHGDFSGRYLRFGVREHGMASIMNGISAYGAHIPFGATFLNFISYAAGASRLTAVSELQGIYIMTHDSIGLGEDGPTHQPIETLTMLRATPNTYVYRPADGNETSAAYYAALTHFHSSSVLSLSRQGVPNLKGSSIEKALKGAYVLEDPQDAKVILVATGTEVAIILDAAKKLAEEGISARIVSFPCFELFEEQSQDYKNSVFTEGLPVISCEALGVFGWEKYAHAQVGMTSFGASAPANQLYETFGITPAKVAEKAKKALDYYSNRQVPHLVNRI